MVQRVAHAESFEVDCVCGNRFRIAARSLLRMVVCATCNRALVPVPAHRLASGAAESTPAAEEHPLYSVKTSQWDNFFRYVTCGAVLVIARAVFYIPALRPNALGIYLCVALLDILTAGLIFLATFTSRCTIYPDRVETESGIFTRTKTQRTLDTLTEVRLHQPGLARALRIGTLTLKTTDEALPEMQLYQVPGAKKLFNHLRKQVTEAGNEATVAAS